MKPRKTTAPRIRRVLRTTAARFATLAICLQFLVPAGYMPGALANGSPFVFCGSHGSALRPDSLAHKPHVDTAHHADHNSHAPSDSTSNSSHDHSDALGGDAWEYCPLGAVASDAALATILVLPSSDGPEASFTDVIRPRCGTRIPRDLNCRAPPRQAAHT